VAVLGALVAAAPAGGAVSACHADSWTAGTTRMCHGALIYDDYVFDDYGADTGSSASSVPGGEPSGDRRYASGEESSADLVRITLEVSESRLDVRFDLNALYRPDATVAALAIDTDDDRATGGGQWGSLDVASKGWDVLATFDRGDSSSNVIVGSLPLPQGEHWRVQAVTGVRGGSVMNVAFRGDDEMGTWFEDKQAAALRDGDVTSFAHTVAVDDMRSGASYAPAQTPGLHERVFTSDYTVPPGEGMTFSGVPGRGQAAPDWWGFNQKFHYLGRYQPYGIYIPEGEGTYGLQMVFHGTGANHTSLLDAPGFQNVVSEGTHRILAQPLVRGPNGYASDITERDVLDVIDDVERTYDIDRDQVFASGYSQGGYIAQREASLYPDRFAGYISWVGFTGDAMNGTPLKGREGRIGAIGNLEDLVGNLRWVPGALMYAGADELVHISSWASLARAFQATDDPYVFYMHPVAEHFTFALLDDWRKETAYSAGRRLVHDPPRVTFRTDPDLGSPAYDVFHDGAYWVSRIRGGAGYQDVDLTTHGCGGTLPVMATTRDAGPDPVPWVSEGKEPAGAEPIARANRLTGRLANVTSLVVDTRPACLRAAPLTYEIETDAPARIELSDGRVINLPAAGRHAGRVG
jgi:predicted esterase